jgi:hypothetical protein
MKTAIEYLADKLKKNHGIDLRLYDEFEQAKEMEKEQSIDFARECLNKAKDLDILTAFMNVEQYYNEIFK